MRAKVSNARLVDLGAATAETKGGPVGKEDLNRTFIPAIGLVID
jgi:hypothetical protein